MKNTPLEMEILPGRWVALREAGLRCALCGTRAQQMCEIGGSPICLDCVQVAREFPDRTENR